MIKPEKTLQENRKNIILIFSILSAFLFCAGIAHAQTNPYWVLFEDRGDIDIAQSIAAKKASTVDPKVSSRRARAMGIDNIFDERDLPVNPEYIEGIIDISGGVRTVTRYFNGVSVELDDSTVQEVRNLPYVRLIRPVSVYSGRDVPEKPEKPAAPKPGIREDTEGQKYGDSLSQVNMVGAVELHNLGYLGDGITVAVLDSGFDNLAHSAFDSIRITHKWDFVESDDNPEGDDHGSQVLAIMAAKHDNNLIGVAPYASYILARTEIVENSEDLSVEEDYWIAGVEWVDSLGADIINSSLGYVEFEDKPNYTYADLDGNTAVTTLAADIAVEKGIVVVTSAGNEGNTEWYYVTTPADGFDVLAIGAVDVYGEITPSSSRGPTFDGRIKPDFIAQGKNVRVPFIDNNSDDYTLKHGTSFAAPAVSGAAALLLEINPAWEPADVTAAFLDTASDLGEAGPDSLYGYGSVNALAASGLEPPEPDVTAFKVFDPFPQPIEFGGANENAKVFFPVEIPSGGRLLIKIYNFAGEIIQTVENDYTVAGRKTDRLEAPSWDGTNYTGDDVAPGIYFYTIRLAGYDTFNGKIAVIR
ncbi:S8 family serine peptidase [Candidatus Latescibacterota bacterium]